MYAYEWWAPVGVVLGGLAAAAGVFVFRSRKILGALLVLGGPAVPVALAPSMLLDRVTVDADHFEGRYGMWWSPTRYDIRYDDVAAMTVREETPRGRRRRKNYSYHLDMQMKAGGKQTIALGDLLKEASKDLLAKAQAKGVAVTIQESGQ